MIRIGKIDYTNTLPIFYYFPQDQLVNKVEMVPQVPSVLNTAMKTGKVDLGPISSFAYAENFEEYFLLPDLSVSALGPVGSIFLFTKKPLEQYQNMYISLTNTSATSVNLLKIILELFLNKKVQYRTDKPNLEEMIKDVDGALLIGDDAIKAKWGNPRFHIYDLGKLWHDNTGKWMTFAVWAVRKEVYLNKTKLLKHIFDGFLYSKKRASSQIDPIIQVSQQRIGGKYDDWLHYFLNLSHDLNQAQLIGLETYYQLSQQLGLLNKSIDLQIITNWNLEKNMSGV